MALEVRQNGDGGSLSHVQCFFSYCKWFKGLKQQYIKQQMGISFIPCALKTASKKYIHCCYCDLHCGECRFPLEMGGECLCVWGSGHCSGEKHSGDIHSTLFKQKASLKKRSACRKCTRYSHFSPSLHFLLGIHCRRTEATGTGSGRGEPQVWLPSWGAGLSGLPLVLENRSNWKQKQKFACRRRKATPMVALLLCCLK